MRFLFARLLFISLLISYSAFGCEEAVFVQIFAEEFQNKSIHINSPFFEDSIELDAKGKGEIQVHLKNKTFAFLTISSGESNYSKLIFLDYGYNLDIKINSGVTVFHGKGSQINSLIENCENYLENQFQEIDLFIEKSESTNEIITFFSNKEYEFETHYKSLTKKIKFDVDVNYLVKNHFLAKTSAKKQQFVTTYFTSEEADSLEVELKLGITQSPLFHDTKLIKSGSDDIMNFLSWNFDFKVLNILPFKKFGKQKYLFAVDSLINSNPNYSNEVKEYLSYANLIKNIFHFGNTKEILQLYQKFQIKYPNSRYDKLIENQQTRFDQLAIGKLAPNFIVKDKNGSNVELKDFKGKKIFIDVWATWCIPCREKMPMILELDKEFDSIVFVFISIDNDKNNWNKFLESHSEHKETIHLITTDTAFESSYRISGVPRYILIDENGIIIDAFVNGDKQTIQKMLE